LAELRYSWTVRESEYATDVIFRDAGKLAAIYPALCQHAMTKLDSRDLLRFLGRRLTSNWASEVTSDLQRRCDGLRVRHRVGANVLKMYDKQGAALRIETVINDPSSLRVWRRAQGDPSSPLQWRKLRKSVADLPRRTEVSRAANHRYLEALAVVGQTTAAQQVLDPVCRPVHQDGQGYRGLHPASPQDAKLFEAILCGEHLLDGFTNGRVQARYYTKAARDPAERRRRSSQMGRLLRLLRRHGLIHKIGARRLYRLTPSGHLVMSMALALRQQPLLAQAA